MILRYFGLSTLFAATLIPATHAAVKPIAGKKDARIRMVAYDIDNVTELPGTMGTNTMITFRDDEQISTVAVGDSKSWEITPDQGKHYLFVKPLDRDVDTNMNVVTTKRIYKFNLHAYAPGYAGRVFELRFRYPDDERNQGLWARASAIVNGTGPNMAQLIRSNTINTAYSYKGSDYAKPDDVVDDGVKTYFKFSGEPPAIFFVNPDRTEALVNYRREADMVVVDKVAGQWSLRNGDEVTCIFNLQAQQAKRPSNDPKFVRDGDMRTHILEVGPDGQGQH